MTAFFFVLLATAIAVQVFINVDLSKEIRVLKWEIKRLENEMEPCGMDEPRLMRRLSQVLSSAADDDESEDV